MMITDVRKKNNDLERGRPVRRIHLPSVAGDGFNG